MRWIYLLSLFLLSPVGSADVIKPALVEISIDSDNAVEIEIRASIEAILTGINSAYQNTQNAPQASQYDDLRRSAASDLKQQFSRFSDQFLDAIWLESDGNPVALQLMAVTVPEPGYTQVPRISTLILRGALAPRSESVQWYYPARFSDHAGRLKQINHLTEQWHWGQWQWIRDDQPSLIYPLTALATELGAAPPWHQTAMKYLKIGFFHILPKGADHVLFILGLFLFSQRWRPLLWQVTAFTIAHTFSLGLATLGYINVSPRLVEPLIAFSIMAVAIENIFSPRLRRSRLAMIFGFGLLHGLGFAGVLKEFELSADSFIGALLSFNIGVELAQITVLGIAWCAVGWWLAEPHYRRWVVIPGSLLISLIGFGWMLQRL